MQGSESGIFGCPHCNRDVFLHEEIVTLAVVSPELDEEDEPQGANFTDDDDDYLYEPYVFHYDCWAEIVSDYHDSIKGKSRPVRCDESIVECNICTSDIRAKETSAEIQRGALRVSSRRPDNRISYKLEAAGSHVFVCIVCLAGINAQVEMWESIDHENECDEGRTRRCWRGHACRQSCKLSLSRPEICDKCGSKRFERPVGDEYPFIHPETWICVNCRHRDTDYIRESS